MEIKAKMKMRGYILTAGEPVLHGSTILKYICSYRYPGGKWQHVFDCPTISCLFCFEDTKHLVHHQDVLKDENQMVVEL